MKAFQALLVVIRVHNLTACQGIKSQRLTGTWTISKTSLQRFYPAEYQQNAGRIVIKAHGSFVADEVPKDLLYRKPVNGSYVSGTGVWKLVDDGVAQRIFLEFRAISEGQQESVPFGTVLNVSRTLSSINLNYFENDADLGRKVEFERK